MIGWGFGRCWSTAGWRKYSRCRTVALRIVPRINATGRIGSSDRAVHLLTCEDMELAGELAVEICDNNDYRRQIENEMVEKALELLTREPDRLYDRVLVVEGEDWHHGVIIGIVASRAL